MSRPPVFKIHHAKRGRKYVYCNNTMIFGQPRKYMLGQLPPNYPVPAIRYTYSDDICDWYWSMCQALATYPR